MRDAHSRPAKFWNTSFHGNFVLEKYIRDICLCIACKI